MEETSRTSSFELRLPEMLVQRQVAPDLFSGPGMFELRRFVPGWFKLQSRLRFFLISKNRQITDGQGKHQEANAYDGQSDRNFRPFWEVSLSGGSLHSRDGDVHAIRHEAEEAQHRGEIQTTGTLPDFG